MIRTNLFARSAVIKKTKAFIFTGTLCLAGILSNGATAEKPPLDQAAIPNFSPPQGPLTNGALISLSSSTTNGVIRNGIIRYTLDGLDPDENSLVYSQPLTFTGPITLKARTFGKHLDPSDVRSVFFGLLNFEKTVVTTFAGGFSSGFSNGIGPIARFSSPIGICVDPSGNLYVADRDNHVIRKITASGEVTTFAGSGVAGSQLGVATNAQFHQPTGVCIDKVGNVYVAEENNCNRISKIDTNGIVTLFANVSGCRLATRLWTLEADPADNIYTGAWSTLRKIAQNGTVTVMAGTGVNGPGGWGPQVGVGIDASSNLYAATATLVWKITPNGIVEPLVNTGGGFSDGPRLLSQFTSPQDVVVDSSTNILVGDITRIRRINSSGWVSTIAGTGVAGFRNGKGSLAQFSNATGLCLDGQGNIYVADMENHCIRKIWVDNDEDEIPDSLEGGATPYIVGTNDATVDSDNDGMSNMGEFSAGTNPLDSNSFLAIDSVSVAANNSSQISWHSVSGKNYVVKFSTDLKTWNILGTPVQGNGGLVFLADPSIVGQNQRRFYRVFLADN